MITWPWKLKSIGGQFYSAGQFPIKDNWESLSSPKRKILALQRRAITAWLKTTELHSEEWDGETMLKKFLSEMEDGLTRHLVDSRRGWQ